MLETLLTKGQHYDISTQVNNFTNHLPMALIALNRLGASDEKLLAFNELYSVKLKSLKPISSVVNFDWTTLLGEKEQFSNYLVFYSTRVDEIGIELTIKEYIDTLIHGCAASAFHALIRLSYGVLQENKTEVAFGLAHLSAHYFTLPESTTSQLSPQKLFKQALVPFAQYNAVGSSITASMQDIIDHQQFAQVNVYPAVLTLSEMSKMFAKLYLQTDDFTVLHSVTSCHAFRTLQPFMQQPELALKSYWTATLVAVLSVNELTILPLDDRPIEQIEALDFNVAINSDEDHLIKLVFSCLEEYKHYGHVEHLRILNSKLLSQ